MAAPIRAADPDAVGAVDPDEHEPLRLGLLPPSPSRISAAACWPRRAARCSAARRRSTAWSMCAATPRDFDHWAEAGATGWAYADVLPYFKRMETCAWRRGRLARHRRAAACAARPAQQSALPRLRRGRPPGRLRDSPTTTTARSRKASAPMEQTIHRGRRWSAANAYLRPALKRKNVSLVKGFARARGDRESTRHRRRDRSWQADSSR